MLEAGMAVRSVTSAEVELTCVLTFYRQPCSIRHLMLHATDASCIATCLAVIRIHQCAVHSHCHAGLVCSQTGPVLYACARLKSSSKSRWMRLQQ